MFLNQKRNLDIKARLVAGGDKQKGILSKEDVGSPTVATESIMITSVIDAHQKRDVATVDIPNAFIQTKVDERIIVCLRGMVADLLVKKFPSQYKKYACKTKNGTSVLYVVLLRALYGIRQAALLFYKKLAKDLIGYGFKLNPVDPYVANKEVLGSQMTVIWHVDDLKISHRNPSAITNIIRWLDSMYGGRTDR